MLRLSSRNLLLYYDLKLKSIDRDSNIIQLALLAVQCLRTTYSSWLVFTVNRTAELQTLIFGEFLICICNSKVVLFKKVKLEFEREPLTYRSNNILSINTIDGKSMSYSPHIKFVICWFIGGKVYFELLQYIT